MTSPGGPPVHSESRSDHGPHVGRALLLLAALSLVGATAFTLSRGEVRTGFHRACLLRFTDAQAYARHRLDGTTDATHPFFGELARRNRTLLPTAVEALTRAGLPFETSVITVVVAVRTMFAVGFAWIVFAASGNLLVSMVAVALAFSLNPSATVYGYNATEAISGIMTASMFLGAIALLLLGRRRTSLVFWLLQGAVHPITFVCWAPVYLGLWCSRWLSRRKVGRAYCVVLLVGPVLVGLSIAAAETWHLLSVQVDDRFWALVRTRLMHTVFLGSERYQLPLQYVAATAALFVLGRPALREDAGDAFPLTRFNQYAAWLAAGIFVLYLVCVETQWSYVAAATLPLCFESVLIAMLLANAIGLAVRGDEPASVRAVSALYGLLLMMFLFSALTWSWLWALFVVAARSKKLAGGQVVAAGAGVMAIALYVVAVPDDTGRLAHRVGLLIDVLQGLLVVSLIYFACRGLQRFEARAAVAVLLAGVMILGQETWAPWRLRVAKDECVALLTGRAEQSAEKQAIDWLSGHVPPEAPVLTDPGVILHVVTPLNVSVNDDLPSLFVYMPDMASKLIDEIESIYGLNVVQLARERRRLSPAMHSAWPEARDRALDGEAYSYVVERTATARSETALVLYENEYVRIYGNPRQAATVAAN
ncbi:MAG: hypothetical protein CMJ18_15900 [Phycisphaeraceae bacterium]|nr:hypothetical protein [Phycisphaeraceae bacterium]